MAAATHAVSRLISRIHSRAAGLVICALGVSEVVGAEDSMIPVREWLARKHAREAPAGPVPMIRRSVVMMGDLLASRVVGEVWLTAGVVPFDVAAAMISDSVRY